MPLINRCYLSSSHTFGITNSIKDQKVFVPAEKFPFRGSGPAEVEYDMKWNIPFIETRWKGAELIPCVWRVQSEGGSGMEWHPVPQWQHHNNHNLLSFLKQWFAWAINVGSQYNLYTMWFKSNVSALRQECVLLNSGCFQTKIWKKIRKRRVLKDEICVNLKLNRLEEPQIAIPCDANFETGKSIWTKNISCSFFKNKSI